MEVDVRKGDVHMRYNMQSRIIGFLFLIGGVGYLGEYLQIWSFSIFFPGWWTLFFIIPAIFSIFDHGCRISNISVLVFGIYLILKANGYIDFNISAGFILALFLIYYGIRMIVGNGWKSSNRGFYKSRDQAGTKDHASNLRLSAFCSDKKIFANGDVNSVHAESICGNLRIDLSEADLRHMQLLSIDCIAANVDIIVSNEYRFIVNKDCVLGVLRMEDAKSGIYDLHIDISCIAGRVNLRKAHSEESFF